MTKQILFISFLIICFFSCLPESNNGNGLPTGNVSSNNETPSVVVPPFEVEFPDGYKILTEASGDLTKDGVDEKVLVLNTGKIGDMGEERVILIFKVETGGWKMIHRSSGVILPSEHGGVMGDPLQSVSVEKGAVVIKHFGGSRVKWDKTHRFRLQNDRWELVGATLITEDACVEKETFDYNLSSGRVTYSHVGLICENNKPRTREIFSKAGFVSKLETLPQMNGFEFGKIHAINPRTKKCIPRDNCYGVEVNEEPVVNEGNTTKDEPVVIPTTGTNEEPSEIPNNTNSSLRDLTDLVGIYTSSGNDKSWILTIFPQRGAMEISYYKVNGLLDDLELIIEGYTPEIIEKFEIKKSDNTIQSDLGKGKYSDAGGKQTITISGIKTHDGDKLILKKNENFGF